MKKQQPLHAAGEKIHIPAANRHWIARYGFALIATGLALVLAQVEPLSAGPAPFVTLFAAVLLSALFGGIGPGVLATGLSATVLTFYIGRTYSAAALIRIGMFIAEGVAMTAIISRLQVSLRTSEQSRMRAMEMEKESRESREKYRLLVESVQDYAITMLDPRGNVISWNPAAQRIHGYKADEILNQHFSKFFPPEIAQIVPNELLERAAREGKAENEGWRVNKDGSRIWATCTITPVYDENKQLRGFSRIARDLTQRRKAEELCKGILESAPDAMVITNRQGQIILMNSQAESLFGYPREQLIGRSIQELVPDEVRELHAAQRENYFDHPHIRNMSSKLNIHAKRKDGIIVPVEISLSPASSPDGVVIIAAIRDVSDRQQVARELQQAKEQAEAANRAKDHFLAVLSHELRTPLTPALLTASAIESTPDLPAEVRSEIELVRRNIQLEAKLIDDLLDVTRIARGKLVMNFEEVDLHHILRAVVQICHDEIAAKSLNLTMELRCPHCTVRGDPARLQQVFWNLLKNAIKFTPPGGSIFIKSTHQPSDPVSLTSDLIRIEFADTGIGIAPESIAKIFDVFEQTNTHITRQFGGLGLGLTISKNLIELHHGTIRASSPGRDKGSTFTIDLPLVRAPSEAPTPTSPSTPAPRAQQLRILLVEDHADTLRSLTQLLRRCGYLVTPTASMMQALQAAHEQTFDLLISDVGLPDGDGNQLMSQLHRELHLRGIALSGYGSNQDLTRNREAGFSELLTKPVTMDELQQAIDRVACNPS